MRMHGLHNDEMEIFRDKPNNEVIILLEEQMKYEKLSKQLQELQQEIKRMKNLKMEYEVF